MYFQVQQQQTAGVAVIVTFSFMPEHILMPFKIFIIIYILLSSKPLHQCLLTAVTQAHQNDMIQGNCQRDTHHSAAANNFIHNIGQQCVHTLFHTDPH